MNQEKIMKPVPSSGETYYYFDDGKISLSRREEVFISEVIPFDEIDEDTLELWKKEVKESSHGLYEKETDFFIKGILKENKKELIFSRSKGGWFGFNEPLWDGRLDVDGELNKRLEQN